MSHRHHPDPDRGDPEHAILYDGCGRCYDHAQRLTSLDQRNLAALWSMMVTDRRTSGPSPYRTANERRAGHELYRVAVLMERLGVDPWGLTAPRGEVVVL